jgi:sulfoxide reductase heme-binding subunit YedZ
LNKQELNVQTKRLVWLLNTLLFIFVIWQLELSLQAPDIVTRLRDVSGRIASYLLLLSLLFTPVASLWPPLRLYVPLRRHVGLWAFAMVIVHLLVWISLEFNFDWLLMWQETQNNLFIWLGLLAFLLLLPMAITSNRKATRKLGYRRWQALHSLTYVAIPLALGHYLMAQKVASGEPVVLMLVLIVTMIWRFKYAH